ncbi:endonuclease/exonuclease/phosphatase family protein [Emticicia sp. BO119]|uniref:endonuclease/exonuclease/phosphatase family protein n=1 Tax=Emticicia sp. BO119 TaxID=2757768 RepID=UPI0015F0C773|nr:endonuclease/exonuclease/phosphatase family protein [Emticicia sp. BO119]MBA4849763.1 endonuclease/exonuclease/phosphatase family protein [Emticicia sp. BO119]
MMEFIRLFLKRFLFFLNMILALYTLLVYQLSYSVSVKHWLGGFLMLSLPLAFAGNVFFILLWTFRRSRRAFISVMILLIGFPLILRTFTWHTIDDEDNRKGISVLSYNLMWCDIESYSLKRDTVNPIKLIKNAVNLDADIKCVQELFNVDYIPQYRMIQKFRNTHPYYTYVHSTPGNDKGQGSIGLAIFSKYPIVRKEEKHWSVNHNGLLSADIVVGKDTIRVINLQLKSMGVRVNRVFDAGDDKEKAKKEAKTIYHQLKEGFNDRIIQMIELELWIKNSPYPIILAGDFNEVPYGYTYGRTRKYLKNAFEEEGRGFGFTYHRSPGFLRIDNQFYDSRYFELKRFKTFSEIPYSDHYPIWGEYILKK